MSFDFSDHTLSQITTWVTVAAFAFALWQTYSPRLWSGQNAVSNGAAQSGIFAFLWENKTLVVAILGVGILAWLNLRQTPSEVIAKAVSDAVTPIELKLNDETQKATELEQKLKAITIPAADADIEKATSQLRDELAAAKQEIIEAKKADGDPVSVTSLPTHIRLQFNASETKPVEIDSANIHWSWLPLVLRVGTMCVDTALGKRCWDMPPQGDKNDKDEKVVFLTLVFDHPIIYKSATTNVNGAKVSVFEQELNSRFLILLLFPDPTNFVLEVKPVP